MSNKKGKIDVSSIPTRRGWVGKEGSGRVEAFTAAPSISRTQVSV